MSQKIDYNNIISYSEIKGKILPFDLIAFRGGDIISGIIAKLENNQVGMDAFSHVGIAVTSDILPKMNLISGRIYIFESTLSYNIPGETDGVPDVITGSGELGVQLRDLEEIIPRYITDEKCHVAWCKLINNPYERKERESDEDLKFRRINISKKFSKIFKRYHGRMYEMDLISLFGSIFPRVRKLRTAQDDICNLIKKFWGSNDPDSGPVGWQFCSELVANIYQAFGLISKDFDTKDVIPIDFFGCDEDGLPILVQSPVFIKDWDY